MARRKLFSVTIADCDVQTFCTGGKGGQNQNKREMGVRIIHRASGAMGEGREHRKQWDNKKAAWKRMGESKKFKNWVRMEAARRNGEESVEDAVNRQMIDSLIRTDVKDEKGRWVPVVDLSKLTK